MKCIRRDLIALALMLSFMIVAPGALAEKADRQKPINLEADKVTLDDQKGFSTYEGNVQLTQGTMMLRAERVVVEHGEKGLTAATATGNPVSFREKRDGVEEYVEAYASRVEYDALAKTLKLIGNAHVKQGGDEVRGNVITYDMATERYQALGGTEAGGSGRVRAVFRPKGEAEPPSPPLPLAPSKGSGGN
jgi:lipopolysaccharide export system protein LptA